MDTGGTGASTSPQTSDTIPEGDESLEESTTNTEEMNSGRVEGMTLEEGDVGGEQALLVMLMLTSSSISNSTSNSLYLLFPTGFLRLLLFHSPARCSYSEWKRKGGKETDALLGRREDHEDVN